MKDPGPDEAVRPGILYLSVIGLALLLVVLAFP